MLLFNKNNVILFLLLENIVSFGNVNDFQNFDLE